MRGSVYYQSSQLVKQIFVEGAKKEDKINLNHEHYQVVSSYKSMETYRNIWNNFFNYLLEHWKIKDFEKIESEHLCLSLKLVYCLVILANLSLEGLQSLSKLLSSILAVQYLYSQLNFSSPVRFATLV